MDETVIRGIIIGVAFGLVGLIATLVWKLIKSPGEGARRLRIIAGVGLAAFVIYGAALTHTLPGLVVLIAIIAGITWVMKGFTKK